MNKWIESVKEFHRKFGRPVNSSPRYPYFKDANLRAALIAEEARETCDAILLPDTLAEIADGIVDTIYVCIGTALEYGIDIEPIFEEVHRTNMLKTGGAIRTDGKILKPQNWQPPRIEEILKAQTEG